ncbi:tapasin isoform X1 [Salmo salar]|uniref:Tapasin-like isoform X1 n=2 Tax=Salmo salar TaxID=8030 RepID=A0A1S3M2G4_SALSA|nr:tapasin-like isoform X1 [Salmo salar]XP_045550623.1 tapasin-like isoform X1 [Salmo salar]
MTNISTILQSFLAFSYFMHVYGASCPVLECWFVQEKPGGGFHAAMSQEKSLLYINTDPDSEETRSKQGLSTDHDRVYYVTDPAATLCSSSMHPPEGSVQKPQCEINPFMPQPSTVQWTVPLTDSAHSPIYLQADWYTAALQGFDGQLRLSNVMRAPTATKEPKVLLSVSSRTFMIRSRLGEPVVLDCGFWVDASSPLSGSGFAVEWRYQFRGDGRLVLAYDGKTDRFAETQEEGAGLDFTALHETGNASLILQEAEVRHSGTYICTVYLPYLLAQVAVELEIVEPPSLSIFPSPLPLSMPGQVVTVQCEASGFYPLSLEFHWVLTGPGGRVSPLGQGSVTGHRQGPDSTYSQTSRVELDSAKLDLGRGGEVTCVAVHRGGTRRASVTLNITGVSAPSIEDYMAMVAVALGIYGLIKVVSWTFSSGSDVAYTQEKKVK